MGQKVAVVGCLVVVLVSMACGGKDDKGAAECSAGDVDCLLAALQVRVDGSDVSLRSLDASLLVPPPATAGPPTIWSVVRGGGGNDGWDGTQWFPGDVSGDLLTAVWVASATDAWAVGYSQRIKHWDGTAWTTWSVGATTLPAYNAIWGADAGDIYAGGSGGTLVRWNGASWSPVDAGMTADIGAIAGSSSSDVWVGGIGGELHHWNGSAWSSVAANASLDITSIWVGGLSEAWATGTNSGVAIHWNGSVWTPMTLPGATYTYAIWGSAASDVWAIAYEITRGTFLLHWDGGAWTAKTAPADMIEFSGLWGRSASDVWLGGNAKMAHWNGNAWVVLEASPGLHASIHGLAQSSGVAVAPSITNQPPPMTLRGAAATADLTLEWTDANGCRPAFCMQVCNASLRCSAKARCSPQVNDGLVAGSTRLTVGYSVAPPSPSETLTMNVVPVSSVDCTDPLAHLVAHDSQASAIDPIAVVQTLTTEAPTNSPSYDGTWNLRVTIDTCYSFVHTVPVTISGGAFSGHLFTYCAEPVNGTTSLATNGCGANITEDASLSFTVDGNDISGNLTLHGGGCDGTNGIEGAFTSATVGQAGSFFGQLDFTR